MVAVAIEEAAASFGFRGDAAEEVVQGAERADPAAEEAAEEDGGDEDDEAPQEALVKGAGGEGVEEGDEGVGLEEEVRRGGSPGECEEERQEEGLRDSAESDPLQP